MVADCLPIKIYDAGLHLKLVFWFVGSWRSIDFHGFPKNFNFDGISIRVLSLDDFLDSRSCYYAEVGWKNQFGSFILRVFNDDLHVPNHVADFHILPIDFTPFRDPHCHTVLPCSARSIPDQVSKNSIHPHKSWASAILFILTEFCACRVSVIVDYTLKSLLGNFNAVRKAISIRIVSPRIMNVPHVYGAIIHRWDGQNWGVIDPNKRINCDFGFHIEWGVYRIVHVEGQVISVEF